MTLKALLLISFVTLTSLFADTSLTDAESRGEIKAKITFLEKQNDELKTKFNNLEDKQKSVEEYKNIIDKQDLRITDLKDTLTLVVGLVALFASIAGYLIYSKAQLNAKAEAQKWLEENSNKLQEKIEDLERDIEKNRKHVEEKTKEYNKTIEDASKSVRDVQKEIEKPSNEDASSQQQKSEQEQTFNFAATLIRQKPESEYTFNEWNILAYDAVYKNKKEDAVFYWTKALERGHASQENLAQALFSKGVILGELNESIKEIEVYEEIDRRFKENKSEKIQEQVVKALFNKGFRLGQMNENEQSIEVYEELDKRFKENKSEKIQEQVAKALLNRGIRLGQMNENTPALKIYKELVKRFNESKNEKIQTTVSQSLINLFESELIENQEWNISLIQQYFEYVKNDKQGKLKLKMLETVKNALQEEQILTLSQLKKEFSDTDFGNWSWKELEIWAEKLEGTEPKLRVQQTIEVFKNWNVK
jgi:tetratricopeptide (TPR) repeat protein